MEIIEMVKREAYLLMATHTQQYNPTNVMIVLFKNKSMRQQTRAQS